MSREQVITSRDFHIDNVNLIGSDGVSVEISALVMEIVLRQDIFLNYMSGEIMVVDALDLINELELHGSEYISLDITEPGKDRKIKKAFRIFKVSNREINSNNSQMYTLHLVSDEMVTSNRKRVSKAYKGTVISNMVKDIATKYIGITDLQYDETGNQMDIIIPSMRPTEAINWLARRAESGEDKYCWFFYENLDGFHFKSLHNIYESNPINSDAYIWQPKTADPQLAINKFTLDSFKARRDFDVLNAMRRGATSMRFIGIDPVHRTIKDNEFSLGDVPTLNKHNLIDDTQDPTNGDYLYSQYDAHRLAYLQTEATASELENGSQLWIKHIQSLAMLNNNMVELVMPGNLDIQIGELVRVVFPNISTPSDAVDIIADDTKFLVVGVVHIFNLPAGTFDTLFTVTRDSTPTRRISTDTGLPPKVRELNAK